jgi:hypothetical protein
VTGAAVAGVSAAAAGAAAAASELKHISSSDGSHSERIRMSPASRFGNGLFMGLC